MLLALKRCITPTPSFTSRLYLTHQPPLPVPSPSPEIRNTIFPPLIPSRQHLPRHAPAVLKTRISNGLTANLASPPPPPTNTSPRSQRYLKAHSETYLAPSASTPASSAPCLRGCVRIGFDGGALGDGNIYTMEGGLYSCIFKSRAWDVGGGRLLF